ncbi:site-specific integrase [Ectopseudomonas oleovorans]|uniref:Site-specific recombinase XerD n=1 Tax=Ectopseudomonas oleovorans TaxID=301 RepID=A0A3D9EFN4_ECTOL|nr:site-specific integrase [Pseudomonas oleovorans]RED02014.1 site-specific recombinase XerD [Pseudomonas oleovorans]
MNILEIAGEYNETHDLRPATRTIYLAAARALGRRFGEDFALEKLHNRDVLIWRKEILDSGLAKRSWNTYASHLKTLFQYAIKHDLLSMRQNPFTETSVVPPRKRKKTVPHEAINQGRSQLLRLQESERVSGKRSSITPAWFWLSVYETFHYTGIRLNSLLMMQRKDVCLKRKTINIRSESDKTHKEFVLPIPGPLYEHLDRLTAWADSLHFNETDQLFNVNRFSQHYKRDTMDINQIESMYKKLTTLVGTRMTPHRFRHTLATDLMQQADRNIHVAKALLNHSSIVTTMEYIETDPHQMRNVLEDRAAKMPKSLLARVDTSARLPQERLQKHLNQPMAVPALQSANAAGSFSQEAFDQLAEWISNGALPFASARRR